MYIHVHKDLICSQCGAMNKTEYITRGGHYYNWSSTTFIRCTVCGHEKAIYSTATDSTGSPVNYRNEPTDNRETF